MNKTSMHPSYGIVSIGRQSSCRTRLFGSAVRTPNCISLEISQARLEREDGSKKAYIYPESRLLEISMSALQFAEMMTSLNCGGGTPCTITWKDGEFIPQAEESTTRQGDIAEEFRVKMVGLGKSCDEFLAKARELKDKPNVNKSDREALVSLAEGLVSVITASTPYVVAQFAEAVEEIKAEAKADSSCFPPTAKAGS